MALSGALLLSGCCTSKPGSGFTTCAANLKEGIPIITCQPVDAFVAINANEKAEFYVGAQGEKLTYQWYYIRGGVSEEPVMIPSATQPLYVIPSVQQKDVGIYFCVIQDENDQNGHTATRTRDATLGGSITSVPGGAAGPFTAVQVASSTGGSTTVCGFPVSTKWARFGGYQTPDASPPPPDIGFRGTVLTVVGTTETPISPDDYYLQLFHTSAIYTCATKLNATEVVSPVTAGYAYRFTAFWKVGKAPPDGTTIKLTGTWTK